MWGWILSDWAIEALNWFVDRAARSPAEEQEPIDDVVLIRVGCSAGVWSAVAYDGCQGSVGCPSAWTAIAGVIAQRYA